MAYTPEQLSDLQCISDAVHDYCHGLDRGDRDWMARAYWPDGTDDHGYFAGNALEFVDLCLAGQGKWRATMHCILNHQIVLEADGIHARGEIYNVTYLFRASDNEMSVWVGRYLDRYQKRGDEWRILERVCVHEGTTTHANAPMAFPAEKFRQGNFDRPSKGRPIGP